MQTEDQLLGQEPSTASAFRTLLVHAEPKAASSHRVMAAAHLARDLDATLIGVGAAMFEPILPTDPFMGDPGSTWVARLQEELRTSLAEAEQNFRRGAAGAKVEWRTRDDYPERALLRFARSADLIVLGPLESREGAASPGGVLMAAGRPVLIVPPDRTTLSAKSVVVAWKNTRECRRATSDALPILRRASDVVALAIASSDEASAALEELEDVVRHLKAHGVAARPLVATAPRGGVTGEIHTTAERIGADLVVCGGYGHARLREWMFGGVTSDLLKRPKTFVLMSH